MNFRKFLENIKIKKNKNRNQNKIRENDKIFIISKEI